ncbi:MAG: RNA-binding protein [Deltaproteobacteria bacterium]|nr:RNA-binding protein [Deltaproteobacteria bacterium]
MPKKLFVGGLSWDTTEETLRRAFSPFGDLAEVKVISDRETGRSRGFGFVSFEQEQDAQRAIGEMDGKTLDGRNIKVNVAEDKPRGEGRSGGGPRGGGYGGDRSGGGRGRW